jgi:hypothetical protein
VITVKKLFSKLSSVFWGMGVALLILIPVIMMFGNVFAICKPIVIAMGNGSILRGLLWLPVVLFGIIQICRAFWVLFRVDMTEMENNKWPYWAVVASIVFTVGGVFGLCKLIQALAPVLPSK